MFHNLIGAFSLNGLSSCCVQWPSLHHKRLPCILVLEVCMFLMYVCVHVCMILSLIACKIIPVFLAAFTEMHAYKQIQPGFSRVAEVLEVGTIGCSGSVAPDSLQLFLCIVLYEDQKQKCKFHPKFRKKRSRKPAHKIAKHHLYHTPCDDKSL